MLLPRDTEVDFTDVATGTKFSNAIDLQYHTGFDLDANVGYDFGMFKAEGEIGYKHASFDAISPSGAWLTFLQNRIPVINPLAPGGAVAPSEIQLNNGLDIIDVMANGLFDIGHDNGFGGYIGGGLGMGFAKAYGESTSSFAWQFIAGARYPVSPNIDLGLRYKYFDMSGLDFKPTAVVRATNFVTDFNGNYNSHSIDLNLTYNF